MDCTRIEELLSPYLDGELTSAEIEMVGSHLSACPVCRRDYEGLLLLSAACKQIPEVTVPAPPDFKNSLMLRLSEEKNLTPVKHQRRFKQSWKQVVAGAAAALVLFLGAVSFNPGPTVLIADKSPTVNTEQTSPASDMNIPTVNSPSGDTTPVVQPPSTQVGSPAADGKTASDPVVVEPAPTTLNSPSSPVFLLNKERTIKTTLLKIKVSDSAGATEKALKIAADNQAQTQNLGQQVNKNGSYTTIKITVAKASAGTLISKLEDLGTIITQEVNTKDIGTRFAEALSHYEVLVNQQASVQDAEQKDQLNKEIQTVVNELTTWEQNAEQETVVLWLEK